jgi:hypothetical protein
MPFGGLGVLGLATAIPKVIASVSQSKKARDLKLQNTQPAAFSEKMALDRQAAASARLPGLSGQQTRLGQVQAGALQSARLGAASGSDFLAAAGAADARRQMGEMQLGTAGLNYQDRSKQQLGVDLTQQAGYQQRDLDAYNRTKAALTQSSAENANNAISGATSYAAAGINRADNLDELAANRAAGITPASTSPSLATPTGGVLGLPYSAPLGVQSASNPYAPKDSTPLYGLRRRRFDTRTFGL